jgi:signal transduction histidine kinase
MAGELTVERDIFLSTLPAGRANRRLAAGVVVVSTAIFVLAAPFAQTQLPQVWAFIPIYEAILVINDLITAVLLFGQFTILRSRALLVLAGGYLFTGFLTVSHALTFPGLFSPTGLLGAGAQSTAWLYMVWHGGFPLFVIAYALLKKRGGEEPVIAARPAFAILATIGVVIAAVSGVTLLATAGQDTLPPIMTGNRYTPTMAVVVTSTWILSFVALVVLWRQRTHSVLDAWLMVVMCVWIFDIALAAVLNAGRFDLGFYAGRIYGLLAASFVLIVLLLENGVLYARLVESYDGERCERRRVEEKTAELAAVNKELDAFSYTVSHDLRTPARAVDGFARVLEEEYAARLDAEGRRLLGVVRESAQRMGQLIEDLLAFARLGRQPLRTRRVELEALVNQTIAELRMGREARRIDFAVGHLGVVEADPALLKQAFANLIGNAIKFTRDKDPAMIEVGRREEGRPEDTGIVYYVKDNGAGFDMRHYDKLFGVFQRLHRADEFEGTGVGLATVQKIITRHGGRVWADSVPGAGATFYFTLHAGSLHEVSSAP